MANTAGDHSYTHSLAGAFRLVFDFELEGWPAPLLSLSVLLDMTARR